MLLSVFFHAKQKNNKGLVDATKVAGRNAQKGVWFTCVLATVTNTNTATQTQHGLVINSFIGSGQGSTKNTKTKQTNKKKKITQRTHHRRAVKCRVNPESDTSKQKEEKGKERKEQGNQKKQRKRMGVTKGQNVGEQANGGKI